MTTNEADPRHAARSVELALDNVAEGGKPFATVVVDRASGEVVHEATNQVAQTGDVTAHAETTAIRELAGLGRTTLQGCDVYVTAYPCPMCLSALYYAEPEHVFYAASREEEAEHYEDGGRYMSLLTFYDELGADPADRSLPTTRSGAEDPARPFAAYAERHAGD
ncbi:nucleoside deaminase [Nocardioidaceae bacterium]|nr:nucleoside deaminase [Nocardioidaceae bacterium]